LATCWPVLVVVEITTSQSGCASRTFDEGSGGEHFAHGDAVDQRHLALPLRRATPPGAPRSPLRYFPVLNIMYNSQGAPRTTANR